MFNLVRRSFAPSMAFLGLSIFAPYASAAFTGEVDSTKLKPASGASVPVRPGGMMQPQRLCGLRVGLM